MIVSVFCPYGIVTASAGNDTFLEMREENKQRILLPINMMGLPHNYVFWNKYALTYNVMNPHMLDSSFEDCLRVIENTWASAPNLSDFAEHLKKMLVTHKFQILGIISGFDCVDKSEIPYVYQILGENIRRANVDIEGNIMYNCIYLEKTPLIWKLMQKSKILNGDSWEECKEIHLRCDLFSLEKSVDLCCFLLKTGNFIRNINSAKYREKLDIELIIQQTNNIEISKIHI